MKRIVILREAGGLGDVVMTEPVVRGLRARWPKAEIVYAGLPEYAELVARFAAPPDAYLPVERHRRRDRDGPVDPSRWPYLRIAKDADLCVDLFCPAFRHERAFGPDTHKSRIECFCDTAGVMPSPPALRISEADRSWAAGFLRGRGADENDSFVALGPWACGVRRQWPKAKWRRLAAMLIEAGWTPLVFHPFGGPIADIPGIKVTDLPLARAAAVMSLAHAAVTHDSGLLHLAAALGVPTVSLWGSTNPAVALACYPTARWLWRPEDAARPPRCRAPCFSMPGAVDAGHCREECAILRAIEPEEVMAMGLGSWGVGDGEFKPNDAGIGQSV